MKIIGTKIHHQSFGALGEPGNETWNFSYNNSYPYWDIFDRKNRTWNIEMDIGSNWTHVAVVYNNDTQLIYVDGVAEGSRSISTPLLRGRSDSLRIGTLGPGNQQLEGMIDDIRIYNRALNILEIRALFGEGPYITAVEAIDNTTRPTFPRLYKNYPNPLNASAVVPRTLISYDISKHEQVVLKVYNILGQQVRTLVNSLQLPGQYHIAWDGKDENDRALPSGLYIYRLQVGSFTRTQKMLLIQ